MKVKVKVLIAKKRLVVSVTQRYERAEVQIAAVPAVIEFLFCFKIFIIIT